MSNFWQNLTCSRCTNCNILNFCCSQTTTLCNSGFFLNTPHTFNRFLLGWEKNGHGTISWFHIFAVVRNRSTMWPSHEIIDCTTYTKIQADWFRHLGYIKVITLVTCTNVFWTTSDGMTVHTKFHGERFRNSININPFASYLNALLVAFMRPQLVIWCE
jgi:hypothetical protein